MVLSTPTADPGAGPDRDDAWLDRIERILRLSAGKVIVLVTEAKAAALGPLVRRLCAIDDGLRVLVDAREVAEAAPGSLILLAPAASELVWLNQNRPLFGERKLRVILWADIALTEAMQAEAPDFFDWISHALWCPAAVPAFAWRGLRAAAEHYPGVAWHGARDDLSAALKRACPDSETTWHSGQARYPELVRAARAAGPDDWLVWTDIADPRDLMRLRWALAESGRCGRSILYEPQCMAPGWWPIEGRCAALADAAELLSSVVGGADPVSDIDPDSDIDPARLAAGLDLESAALALAGRYLGCDGTDSGDRVRVLEAGLHASDDAGVQLARLAMAHDLVTPEMIAVDTLADSTPAAHDRDEAEGAVTAQRAQPAERALLLRAFDREPAVQKKRTEIRHAVQSRLAELTEPDTDSHTMTAATEQGGPPRLSALLSWVACLPSEPPPLPAPLHARGSLAPWLETSLHVHAGEDSSTGDAETWSRLCAWASRLGLPEAGVYWLEDQESNPDAEAQVLTELAIALAQQGELARARALLERSLATATKRFGTDHHPDVATSLHELASVLHAQGDLARARERLERVLAIYTKLFGTDEHPDVAASLHELATVLHAQGDLDGARERLERSLAIYTKLFGTDEHLHAASSLHEMARVLYAQGDLREARERLERSLAIYTKLFGTDEHPNVAVSLNNLAGVLLAQGDLAGARERLERSLVIKTKLFGTDQHPDVAVSFHALAGVLQAQGDLRGARERLEHSLAINNKLFGTDEHPSIAASLHALASVLHAQGDLRGAREHLERSLAIGTKLFGTDEHPDVAASLHELARVHEAEGDRQGAIALYRRVLDIEAGLHGTREHYSSAATEATLGMCLLREGQREEAVALLIHAMQVFQAQVPNHPWLAQVRELLDDVAAPADE